MPALDDLIAFLDASPSPWHAAATRRRSAATAGFEPLDARRAVDRRAADAASSSAARRSSPGTARDSADRRVTTAASSARTPTRRACGSSRDPTPALLGWKQLGVEVYGGALLNSWLDRDLGVAGTGRARRRRDRRRRTSTRPSAALPSWRSTSTATSTSAAWCSTSSSTSPRYGASGPPRAGEFAAGSPSSSDVADRDDGHAGTCACSTAPRRRSSAPTARCWPAGASTTRCRAGRRSTRSSPRTAAGSTTAVVALFDHEEVGSESADRRRRAAARARARATCARQRSRPRPTSSPSWRPVACVSADNAHAVHPNYPSATSPTIGRSSTTARRSSSTATSATRPSPRTAAMLQRGVRRRRRAVAGLRQPQQHAVRHDDRPDHGNPTRHRDRRRRRAAAVDALGARAVRRRRPGVAGDRPAPLLRQTLTGARSADAGLGDVEQALQLVVQLDATVGAPRRAAPCGLPASFDHRDRLADHDVELRG